MVTKKRTQFPEPEHRTQPWVVGPRADRTRKKILEAAKTVFLERGYSGVRVEDIADAAAVSRATFYVYFPSKRDAFLAIGTGTVEGGIRLIKELEQIPAPATREALERWTTSYLDLLDGLGAFIRMWRQSAWADPDMEWVGHQAQLAHARRLGLQLDRLRGRSVGDPALQGLAVVSMIEGIWNFWRVADTSYTSDEIVALLTVVTEDLLR